MNGEHDRRLGKIEKQLDEIDEKLDSVVALGVDVQWLKRGMGVLFVLSLAALGINAPMPF